MSGLKATRQVICVVFFITRCLDVDDTSKERSPVPHLIAFDWAHELMMDGAAKFNCPCQRIGGIGEEKKEATRA